jgi:DNA-binding transcriptional LysR family regulator
VNYTLQQLRYLVAVAEHENVSAAARSLYVSQPGVSAAVSHLETTFGIQCFVRNHAKGMTLTPAGKSFVAAVKEVLILAEALHHRAHELTKAVRGHITLGCCTILSPFFLPQLMEILAATYPEISLHIQLGDVDSLHRWLREGTIEIGLMYDLNCDPAVYSKHPLAQLRLHALLPESHPLAAQQSVTPDDLVGEHLFLLNCTRSADHLLSVFRFARERPKIKHKLSDFDLVRGLVAAGNGYTILHVLPVLDRACQGYPVKWVPIEGDHRSVAVVMASMHMLKPSGRRKALIDACNAMMQNVDSGHCRIAS